MRPIDELLGELTRLGVTLEAEGGSLRVRGPAGAVGAALREELAARKPELLAQLGAEGGGAPPLARRPDPEAPAPLTFNQRRLWFLEKLGETGDAFTMSAAWELRGRLDIAALGRALGGLTRRHAVLRARIEEREEEPRLVFQPWRPWELEEERAEPDAVEDLLRAAAETSFDLSGGPLFRVRLVRLEASQPDGRWLFVVALHHLIADRWSMGILFRDLAALMAAETAGETCGLPDPSLQFGDFAAWQRRRLSEAALAPELEFWRSRLQGAPSDIALPLDRPRPAVRGRRGADHRFPLPPEADLSRLAAGHGATAFMAYLAVYAMLLARWSGQDELVVGCPLGSREQPETHELIGFFVNTVALRLDLSDDPDFATLLRRARAASLEALAHQDVPFDRIVEALAPQRQLNRNPLFQVMFVLQNAPVAPLAWPGIEALPLPMPPMAPEVDLNLALEPPREPGAPFTGYLEYDPELFDTESVERFGRQFAALARAVARQPDLPLSRLPIEDGDVASWAGPVQPLPDRRLDALILERLAARPEAAAVIEAGGAVLTAGELARRATALAAQLRAAGLEPGQPVGVCLPRGAELVVALLGSLVAGTPFVVLQPDAPGEQRRRIAEIAELTLAVAEPTTAELLPPGVRPLLPQDARAVPAPPPAEIDGLAYLCFTSGSSGTPKGIAVGQRALTNHALAISKAFGLKGTDRVLQFAAPAFDVALEEIFPTLLAGATLVVPPTAALDSLEGFGRFLGEAGVTVANLPAPFWHAWVRDLAESGTLPPASLRLLVTGSDRVHAAAVEQWRRLAPNVAWLSGYGPSEATITASLFDPRRDRLPPAASSVPLGRPIANLEIHLVDGAGRPVPTGVVGEIVIEGAGLADGYLGGAADDGFRPRRPGGRPAYWTGDLGRRLADGGLEFVGRRDGQLKIRGVRVEPAAVEAVLAAHPAAGEVAVAGRRDSNGNLLLCASITGAAKPEALRRWAAERLPAALVPTVFERLEALPTSASGKLDRRALAAQPLSHHPAPATAADLPPTDERQRIIAAIFAEVLERPDIRPDSNFFEEGGDSIRSLQIVARARRAGLAVTARMIFQHQTVAAIAAAAAPLEEEPEGPPGTGPLPLTPAAGWFREHVNAGWRHFNQAVVLAVPKPVDAAALEQALAALVACHDVLRLTVEDREGAFRCQVPESGPAPTLTVLDLAGLDTQARAARRAEAFATGQASLDPESGRNLAAVLLPDEGRLLLTIHHLCVDVLSWRVLLDDLEAAYEAARQGRAPRLRRPAVPFRLWAERMAAAAGAAEAGDLGYWLGLLAHPADLLLPEAGEAPGVDGDGASVSLTLEKAVTADVLRSAPAAFGVRPDEVILAALLLVLRRRGGSRLRVELERNGRVSPFEDLDLSRTVGWFTSIAPLLLDQQEEEIAELLPAISRAVAESPLDGLGYGLQRYLGGPAAGVLAELPQGQVLLNFVGELTGWNETPFRPVVEDPGPAIAAASPRSHVLELNAGVVEGRLLLDLGYPGTTGCDAQAEALLAELASALGEIARAARAARSGVALSEGIEAVLPLTPLQRGILLHSLREQETYFDQLRLTLHGPLDAAALRTAWRALVARHQLLRAAFLPGTDGESVQVIHQSADPAWSERDWRALDEAEQGRRIGALMAADRATGFDLACAPLLRLHLVRTGEARHELVWSAHHLLLDGWSVSLVMDELVALYREACGGPPAALPPAPDFGRYLDWLGERDRAAAEAYWQRSLAGLSEPSLLADAGSATAGDEAADAPAHAELVLAEEEVRAIEALARASGVTVGQAIQGAWALLLGRYTGLRDVVFGLTVSGRPPELEGAEAMVGMLINTLPVRVSLPRSESVGAWLSRLGEESLERAAHAETALPDAVAAAGLPSGTLPFDSLVLIQNYPRPKRLEAGPLEIELAQVVEATSFPLTLVADWAGSGGAPARLALVRDPRRLTAAACRQLLGHLRQLLRAMSRDAAAPLDSLSLYEPAERERRIALGRGPRLEVPPALVHEILDDWAELAPEAPAVVAGDASLSYRALAERSDAVAGRLAAAGLRPGGRVVLALPRSSGMVAAFLGILKAGGAVVPLDLCYPAERLRFLLEDCEPALVVTEGAQRERLPLAEGLPVLLLDELPAGPAPAWTRRTIDPEGPAYVIYTSGSTGRPKGVLAPHRGLRALIAAQRTLFGLRPGDRVLQYASLSFDASVWEMVLAVGAGAALHLPSREEALAGPELGAYLRSHRITVATLPPSLLAVIPEGAYPDLRLLGVAGEACPPALARRWAQGRRFFNGYGPSETTICATVFDGGGDGLTLPIGRAIPNSAAHVVDDRLEPVPPGGVGELLVGGCGLAMGYLGRPALTAERFIPDPFESAPGARLYRTGDRVRLEPDGNLVFLGRLDRQVKLRGFRIEPGEVEAALAAQPGVAQALAGVRADRRGEERLLAWVLPTPGAIPDPERLRRELVAGLPGHMVPAAVIPIEAVPLTRNGKVDWSALPGDPGQNTDDRDAVERSTAGATSHAIAPTAPGATPEEVVRERLATLWRELLDRPSVGPDENFFDLGGHSLLLVQLQAQIRNSFDLSLPIGALFGHPTLRSLARHLLERGVTVELPSAPAEASPTPPAADTAAEATGEPIAVVGMAGRFPGAPDLESYWRLLVEEREGIARFEPDVLRRAGVAESLLADPAFVAAGGILAEADGFDPAVFGIGPRDAMVLDPQHRVFLECAWHALEDAGYAPGGSAEPIGLFAGSGYNTWLREVLLPAGESLEGSGGFHLVTGNDKDFLATQAAYRLDLTGPAVTVQTACSTSLVAVAQAVEALQSGRCSLALAGGVAIGFPQERGYRYEPDMILSPDGHCRAFSAEAAGTVPSSGAGVVLLKPLSRARAEGDRVLAVIRGAAVNNDGSRKMGFTTPGVEGQAAAIRSALAAAGLEAGDVDYVEAHGTGTALGDPVEVTALARAYGGRSEPLLLGSVKSNIGHADAAAGIAGFIKAVLSLDRGLLPASLHAQPANPRIDFSAGPFEVVQRTQPWPRRDRPLRAGVSSFGIGGTNAHVILEAAPPSEAREGDSGAAIPQVLILSAQTETALQRQAEQMAAHLRAHPDERLADVAYTLQRGRAALRHRRAVVASDTAEAAELLESATSGPLGRAAAQPPGLALLLPGQGSQDPKMGRALYEQGGVFRRELDTLSESLQPLLGLSLTGLLYSGATPDPEALRQTEIAQPAVFALSLALARQWQALALPVEGLLGHSVGEYAAACLAGVFAVEDALALIVERGRLVGALPGGAMLALGESESVTQALLDEFPELALAAVNGARQCVVSGPEEAVAALEERLAGLGRPGRRLQTSHAFHSPMMAPAADDLAAAVARSAPKPPRERFVSNVTGRWIAETEATDPRYWARQLQAPVRFADGLATLRAEGIGMAVECGPGQALTALGRAAGMTVLPSLAPAAKSADDGSWLARAASALWVEGVALEWPALHPSPRQRVALPLYPFERRPFRPAPRTAAPEARPAVLAKRPAMAEWFYRPAWTPAAAAEREGLAGPWLILSDAGGVGAALAGRLAAEGATVTLVGRGSGFAARADGSFTVQPAEPGDYRRLLDGLKAPPHRLLHLWGLDEGTPEALEEQGLHALLALMQAAGDIWVGHPLRLDLVTRGAAEVTGAEALRPELAAAVGAAKVLPYEYPDLTLRAIDLETAAVEATAERLAEELALGGIEPVVALRAGTRWTPTVRPLPLAQVQPSLRDAVVLITGGFGGLGAAVARDLAREPGMRLVLLGRRALPAAADWDRLIAADDPLAPRLLLVRELEAAGAEVMTAALELSDETAVAEAVGAASIRFGSITGVIHTAGVADLAGVVQTRARADTERVLAPKMAGTRALERALAGQPVDFLLLCSTLGSFLPAAKFGQVAYAAANEFLDLAASAIAARTGWHSVAVNWDDWIEAGMTVAAYKAWGKAAPTAADGLTAQEGTAALRRILAGRQRRVAVSVRDLPALIAEAPSRFHALAQPLRKEASRETPVAAPARAAEEGESGALVAELTEAFRRILEDPEAGSDDSFFERGGHSLLAMQLLAFLRERCGARLGIAAIFDHPTPRRLAAHVEARRTATTTDDVKEAS